MKYTVELVHASDGSIDTLEQLRLDPYHGYSPLAGTMMVTNGNLSARDVYIRVRSSGFSGVQTADSLVAFQIEMVKGGYPSDTSLATTAYKNSLPGFIPVAGHLAIGGIFPNPVGSGKQVGTFVAYPAGHQMKATLFDELGREMAEQQNINSLGEWQRVGFGAPNISGVYCIRVEAGGESAMIRFTVLK